MKKKTSEQFRIELANKHPFLEWMGAEYINGTTDTTFRCRIHDYSWIAKPDAVLKQKYACRKCVAEAQAAAQKKTHEQFMYDMKNKQPTIDALDIYAASDAPLRCRCKVCGYEWNPTPNSLLDGHGCPHCKAIKHSVESRKTHDCFMSEMREKHPSIEVISEYITALDPIMCKCKKCGSVFRKTPNRLLSGEGCAVCSLSKGETAIKKYLDDHLIQYIQEYKINDCRDQKPLPFDFYLPMFHTLIEYDGEQHYRPVTFAGYHDANAQARFELTQEHDKIKTNYCVQHAIPLIRIPYTEFDRINEILDELFA